MKSISFLILFSLLSAVGINASCPRHRLCEGGGVVPNLFVYSKNDFSDFLKKYGHKEDSLLKVDRDSLGTRLYFHFEDGPVLFVGAEGIQRRVKRPAKVAFVNDRGEFVAWTNDYGDGVNFNNGMKVKLPKFARFGIDYNGQYYFIQSGSQSTDIFRTAKAGVPLASAKMGAETIFVKNGKVYLFGSHQRNVRGPGDYEIDAVIGNIFNITDQTLKFEREIRFERPGRPGASPFVVLDVDPYSDHIILLDVYDDPSRSKLYLGKLNSNKLANLGFSQDYTYFLRTDILQENSR